MARSKDKYTYSENENVYKIGRIRFFGGDERKHLKGINSEALLREVLEARIKEDNFGAPMSIEKEYNGHRIKFTQTQMRALLLHTKEVK